MLNTPSHHRKALVYCVDENELPQALFAAYQAATRAPNRDFDILICGLDPQEIPPDLQQLGIEYVTLNLRKTLEYAALPQGWHPLVVYLRLWLPAEFAGRYDRILYNDADTMVSTNDLSALFEVDLGPHALAATLDKSQLMAPDDLVLDFLDHDINCKRYLNSGVMLFDVPTWNSTQVLDQLLAEKDRYTECRYQDQSLINLTLRGRFAVLSPYWNWQWPHHFPRFSRNLAPGILHFSGPPKPWEAYRNRTNFETEVIVAYQEFFRKHDLPRQFDTLKPGGLRRGPAYQLALQWEQLVAQPKLKRLMAAHPDPLTTRL